MNNVSTAEGKRFKFCIAHIDPGQYELLLFKSTVNKRRRARPEAATGAAPARCGRVSTNAANQSVHQPHRKQAKLANQSSATEPAKSRISQSRCPPVKSVRVRSESSERRDNKNSSLHIVRSLTDPSFLKTYRFIMGKWSPQTAAAATAPTITSCKRHETSILTTTTTTTPAASPSIPPHELQFKPSPVAGCHRRSRSP